MVNVHIGDDVLYNILARLPGKPLLRLRCVSKHWNHLISDPYFMKLRSRRMIILPFPRPLAVIDDNVPVEDKAHSMVRIRSPLEHQEAGTRVSIVGTLNGIVLLSFYDTSLRCHLVLYNPLTCASKILLVMDSLYDKNYQRYYVLGFAYGDDLKIVRFQVFGFPSCIRYKWDVFDLKTSSWSTPQYLKAIFHFMGDVGMFLNGFLYWSTSIGILALNVKDMVISQINLPCGLGSPGLLLGSLDGCLCMVNQIGLYGFDVWLWKEQSSWTKAHSFTFGLEGNEFHPICILGNGKILMTNSSIQLVIYDTSKHSYKTLDGLATLDDLKRINMIFDLKHIDKYYHFKDIRSMEYVESLVSPSNMCFI